MKYERKIMEIPERKKGEEVPKKRKGEETSYRRTIQTKENIKVCIIDMLNRIDEEKFLTQIYIILKRHIEKRGD